MACHQGVSPDGIDDLDTVNIDGAGIRARNDPQVIGAEAGNAYGVTGSRLGPQTGEQSNEYVWFYTPAS